MLIAVPSDGPGGLDAPISEHFGHCAAFTVVAVQDGEIGQVSVVENGGHEQGGCMAPVHALKAEGVEVLVAGGMGMRPLAGFQEVGIAVHFKEDARSVRDAVTLFLAGKCRAFGESETCGSGSGGCGGHHHQPVEREPIVGPADVRDGRIVTFDYTMHDSDGNLVDSSQRSGPMRYLHGAGQLLPRLEEAMAGLEPGAETTVEIAHGDAFGEWDEAKVFEVPRGELPGEAFVGAAVSAQDPQGRPMSFTVVGLGEETARLDGNHPLAGKDLVFDVTVLNVEAATAQEIEHGHVH